MPPSSSALPPALRAALLRLLDRAVARWGPDVGRVLLPLVLDQLRQPEQRALVLDRLGVLARRLRPGELSLEERVAAVRTECRRELADAGERERPYWDDLDRRLRALERSLALSGAMSREDAAATRARAGTELDELLARVVAGPPA